MAIPHTAKNLKNMPNLKTLQNSISKFSQHHANPTSPLLHHPNISNGSSSLSAKRYSSATFLNFNPNRISAKPISDFGVFSNGVCSNLNLGCCCSHIRWFCGSRQDGAGKRDHRFREFESPKMVSEVIEVIKRNGDDLEAELEGMGGRLSLSSVIVIFRALNSKVSLLRFFDWIRQQRPDYGRNADVCGLVISNCGWLGDYDSLGILLKDFSSKGITLSRRAFDFVPVVMSRKPDTLRLVEELIVLLNQVGGSCRASGFLSLVETFSLLGRFDLCKYVIKKSDRRNSYYNVMIKERFRKGDFDGAMDILDEMKQAGCEPDNSVYNNLLSRLCEGRGTAEPHVLLEDMLKRGFRPDELTYEILICFCCKNNKLDSALKLYDRMVSNGLKPRLTTHAAFIKHYFNLKQYDDAYRYIVSLTDKHMHLGNKVYSLLINLHSKQRNFSIAHEIVSEMISRGLRPEFNVYMRLLHRLQESGKGKLVRDLKAKLSSLDSKKSLEQ